MKVPMSMLAFCPWLRLDERTEIGPSELVPYKRGEAPFGAGTENQAVVDAILEPYVDEPGRPIERAVLVRRRDRDWMAELHDDERGELFDFTELLAFAGLAARRFYDDGFGFQYASRDHYRLIVQAFGDARGGVFVESRRRDGSSGNYQPSGSFMTLRPEHVSATSRTPFDVAFLNALVAADLPKKHTKWFEAALALNAANTDSPTVSEQMEAVLSVGSLEQLLVKRGGDEEALAKTLVDALQPAEILAVTDCPRLATDSDVLKRFAKCASVSEAWIRDFFRARGDYAHGRSYQRYPAVWSRHEHLLLASYITPRILKVLLARSGDYTLTEDDQIDIDAFEALACADLFDEDQEQVDPWPWKRIRNDVWHRRIALKLAEALQADRQSEQTDGTSEDQSGQAPADILDQLSPQDLTDDEAMELAVREVRAHRSGQ